MYNIFPVHCMLYNRQNLLYRVLCTIGSICSTLYYVQQVSFAIQLLCTIDIICSKMRFVQKVAFAVQFIMYIRQNLQYNVFCTIGSICSTIYCTIGIICNTMCYVQQYHLQYNYYAQQVAFAVKFLMYNMQHQYYSLSRTIGIIFSTMYYVQQVAFAMQLLCTIDIICSKMCYVQQVSFAVQFIMYIRYHLQYNVSCTIGIICSTMYHVQQVFCAVQCMMYNIFSSTLYVV